jgi:hypothetical protein
MKSKSFSPGETWENRKGERFGILYLTDDKEFPIIAIDKSKTLHKFSRDGRFTNSRLDHPKDLTKRVLEDNL